jgi:hypothetical protein
VSLILAGIAVPLIIVSISASNQGTTTPIVPVNTVIDFSVYPENHANAEPIIAERGVAKSIPLKVEAPNDAEGTLQMQLTFGPDTTDPAQLDAELSQTTVVLSKLDLAEGKVTELSPGRGTRDAGTLTLNPPVSMQPGEYSLMLEVENQPNGALGPTLGSGTLIYVTVE